jgi:hypothetical protein
VLPDGVRPMGGPPPAPGLPDPAAYRRRVHAQRPRDLPHRPARPTWPHRLHPHRSRISRPRSVRLGCRPTSTPPVPRCALPSAGPAGFGTAGRVPAGIAPYSARQACRQRRPPTRRRQRTWAGGRQARQHRSDRLGLLLRQPAASLTAQRLHLEGEPWRPRSCPSSPTAGLAGGGSRAGVGRGSGLGMHGSLLAHGCCAAGRVQSTAAGGRWECATRIPILSRHANQGVRASACAKAAGRSRSPRRSSAKAAERGRSQRSARSRLIHQPIRTPVDRNLARTCGLPELRHRHRRSARGSDPLGSRRPIC